MHDSFFVNYYKLLQGRAVGIELIAKNCDMILKSNDEKLHRAVEYLNLNFTAVKRVGCFEAIEGEVNSVCVKDGVVVISYAKRSDFFFLLTKYLCGAEITDARGIEKLGVMVDCARNAVPDLNMLKEYIVRLALGGYNYIGLYLEDCLEVDGEPLFGYMRGRYSVSEIKALVEFADLFGIEVVPFVQTLAHLARIFNHWDPYVAQVKDINDILLMGCDRTYELIDNVMRTIAAAFGGGRVNVGLDEAFMMTFGKYRQLNGIADVGKVFSEHVQKVVDICIKYGLKPEAWSDMFVNYSDAVSVPDGLTLRSWAYSETDKTAYGRLLKQNLSLTSNVCFATAVHKWYGYAPLNEYSVITARPAIEASIEVTDDILVTLWGDEGAECSLNNVWYGLLSLSDLAHGSCFAGQKADRLALLVTGYTMAELLAMDLPNKVFEAPMAKPVNVSKYVLFEDLFYGIADRADNKIYTEYFAKSAKVLKKLSAKKGVLKENYRLLYLLCEVLTIKNDLRIDIMQAYQDKDVKMLKEIVEIRLKRLIPIVKKLKIQTEELFLKENKPFGVEVQTIRFAGLVERLEYIKKTLKAYSEGRTDIIPELEEANASPQPKRDEYNGAECFNNYEMNVTYCALCYRIFN